MNRQPAFVHFARISAGIPSVAVVRMSFTPSGRFTRSGHVMRGEPESEQFSVLYYRDGRLLAVDSVNRPVDYMAVRKALSDGGTIDAARAADVTVPLKNLITRPAQSG